jgi:hypothetical protein
MNPLHTEQQEAKQKCINYLIMVAKILERKHITLKDFQFTTKNGIREYPDGFTMVKEFNGTVKVNIEIEYKVE